MFMYNDIYMKQAVDLSKKLLPLENQWVALSEDQKEILGAGKTLKAAQRQVEKINKRPLFLKVPPFDISYVPSTR